LFKFQGVWRGVDIPEEVDRFREGSKVDRHAGFRVSEETIFFFITLQPRVE